MRMIFALAARRKNKNLTNSVTEEGLKKRLRSTASSLAALCGLHTGAMMAFEKLSFVDSLWLTLTTAATVGYGDLAAKTLEGRAATSLLMYAGGVALMAQTVSLVFERHQMRRDAILKGKWKWNMEDHIVFLNSPKHNPNGYFKNLVTEFRNSALPHSQRPALIVSPEIGDNLSTKLREKDVGHVSSILTEASSFENSNITKAAVIVVLTHDENDPYADSITLDLVSRARKANPTATIIAETVAEENKQRLLDFGANNVVRTMRSYPEMLVRTILTPGAESVIEDIFNSAGDECVRYNVPIKGTWADIATRFITKDIGIPISYINAEGKTVPGGLDPSTSIEGTGVIAIVRKGNIKPPEEVIKLLSPETTNKNIVPFVKRAAAKLG